MKKDRVIGLLKGALDGLGKLRGVTSFRDPALKQWQLETAAMLERVFGDDSRQHTAFADVGFSPGLYSRGDERTQREYDARGMKKGMDDATALLLSLITEVEQFWDDDTGAPPPPNHLARLARVFGRFHQIARQLRNRHAGRATLDVGDEYDVQDLLHAILIIDFDDVRSEEWTPSYAGACARCDFLLKAEQVVVEVKKTRKGLGAREVGEQLIIDVQRYQGHPDCGTLVCFVYDPEGLVANPRGVINDLESRSTPELPVRVFIEPG